MKISLLTLKMPLLYQQKATQSSVAAVVIQHHTQQHSGRHREAESHIVSHHTSWHHFSVIFYCAFLPTQTNSNPFVKLAGKNTIHAESCAKSGQSFYKRELEHKRTLGKKKFVTYLSWASRRIYRSLHSFLSLDPSIFVSVSFCLHSLCSRLYNISLFIQL